VDHISLAVQEDDCRKPSNAVLGLDGWVVVGVDRNEDEILTDCIFELFSTENFSL
jgi:hypothetical protein